MTFGHPDFLDQSTIQLLDHLVDFKLSITALLTKYLRVFLEILRLKLNSYKKRASSYYV